MPFPNHNNGIGSYASPHVAFGSSVSPHPEGFQQCAGAPHDGFVQNGFEHHMHPPPYNGGVVTPAMYQEPELDWSAASAPTERVANTDNFSHGDEPEVLWTTPSPGSRPSQGSRSLINGLDYFSENGRVPNDEMDSPSNAVLPVGSAPSPWPVHQGGKELESGSDTKNSKATVRRKAKNAVYKCLRDVVDRRHLEEPGEQEMEEIVAQLQEVQQGSAEFIDAEWVRSLWGKFRQELLKDAKETFKPLPALPTTLDPSSQLSVGAAEVDGADGGEKSAGCDGGEHKGGEGPWEVGSKIEAQDREGSWYRAEVAAVSFTGRQVQVKFAGWDSKWNEWIGVEGGRVRAIQHPLAKRIRKDGTPVIAKRKGEEGRGEGAQEEKKEAAPALSREEARAVERARRVEAEAAARAAKERRREGQEERRQSAMHAFLQQEMLRLQAADVALTVAQARKQATEAWKRQQGAGKQSARAEALGMEMGMIIGSVHQIYVCNDEETPEAVAGKLGVDLVRLVQMNCGVYPHLQASKKLMQGTMLKLPGRSGSGGRAEVTVFAKVQGGRTVVLEMREGDKVKALKRLVHDKEGVPVKEMAVLFAGQKLDENATLSDYNIRSHDTVHVQVGSGVCNDAAAAEVEEVEYDSGWMQSAVGQRFLATADGERWLKTTAGKLWKQEMKAQRKGAGGKGSGEGGGRGMSAYNQFMQAEVPRVRAQHPLMEHRTAWQRVAQMWRMQASPDAPRHRAEWARLPSVAGWNALNVVAHWKHSLAAAAATSAEGEGGGAAPDARSAGEGEKRRGGEGGAGSGKKGRKREGEDGEQAGRAAFSNTYDWSYREEKLSRTAKKAARISLTTDTLEMLTCELEGLDDRYDGSGWTTFRRAAPPLKPKAPRKPKSDAEPRKRKAAEGKEEAEGKGKERREAGLPRWIRGVPRCPQLPLHAPAPRLLRPADLPAFAAASPQPPAAPAASAGEEAAGVKAEVGVEEEAGAPGPESAAGAAGEEASGGREGGEAMDVDSKEGVEGAAARGGGEAMEEEPGRGAGGEEGKKEEGGEAEVQWLPLPDMGEVSAALQSNFRLPLPQAQEVARHEYEDAVCMDSGSAFPTPFVPIRRNKYVQEKQATVEEEADGNRCQCIFVPGMPETACGAQGNCMLRDLFIECSRKRCPCGKYCLNQRLQRSQWARCSIFKASNGRGWCLRTDEELSPGQLAVEYVGEVVSGEEVQRRTSWYKGKRHTYLLKLSQEEFVDSTRMANLARFINHCCEPNCEMQKWHVGQEQRVGLFAKYRIPAGAELTFDYDMEFYGAEDIPCLCGAPKCRGTLGRPKEDPKPPPAKRDPPKAASRAPKKSASGAGKARLKAAAVLRAEKASIAKAKRVAGARRKVGGQGGAGAAAAAKAVAVRGGRKGKLGKQLAARKAAAGSQKKAAPQSTPRSAGKDSRVAGAKEAAHAAGAEGGEGRRREAGGHLSDRILAKVLAMSEMESSGAAAGAVEGGGGKDDPYGLMSPAERRQQEAALKAIAKLQAKAAFRPAE